MDPTWHGRAEAAHHVAVKSTTIAVSDCLVRASAASHSASVWRPTTPPSLERIPSGVGASVPLGAFGAAFVSFLAFQPILSHTLICIQSWKAFQRVEMDCWVSGESRFQMGRPR